MIGHPKLLTLHQCQRIRLQSTPVNVPSYNIGPGSGCVVVEQGIGNPFSKLKGFGGDDFHKLQFLIVSIALKTFVDQLNAERQGREDRKSTRLNSSHVRISYAVFCLKKKIRIQQLRPVLELGPLLLELSEFRLPLLERMVIAAPGEDSVRAGNRIAGEGADDDQRQRR